VLLAALLVELNTGQHFSESSEIDGLLKPAMVPVLIIVRRIIGSSSTMRILSGGLTPGLDTPGQDQHRIPAAKKMGYTRSADPQRVVFASQTGLRLYLF